MCLALAYHGSSSDPGASAPGSFPSLPPVKFRQGSDLGFLQLVEEASRSTPHSQLSFGNSEPFLLKGAKARVSVNQETRWNTLRDAKDTVSFDWSRNINKLKSAKVAYERTSSRDRVSDREDSFPSTPTFGRARWRGDGIVTSTRVDAVTGRNPFSELVVELGSRDSSPLTKAPQIRWPSVVSLHGRPHTGRRRHRRGSATKERHHLEFPKFPQISSDDGYGSRVPPLPQFQDLRKLSKSDIFKLKTERNPRTPRGSRRPQRSGEPKSPLLSRSPRSSFSKAASYRSLLDIDSTTDNDNEESSDSEPLKDNCSARHRITPTADTPDSSGAPATPTDMGMGTLLSTYPRGIQNAAGGLVVSMGVSQPLAAPMQAWSSHSHTSQGLHWLPHEETRLYPWSSGKKGSSSKVSWTAMMEVGVQTEAVQEEELDWDLSNHEDRETQTLPPNPTHFQLSRTDAFVQTDYRSLPLVTAAPRPSTTRIPIKLVDASTQTERTTTSVSTQTEAPYLMPTPVATRPTTSMSGVPGEVLHSDASAGPSTSGLGSALPRVQALPSLPGVIPPTPPLSPTPTSPERPSSKSIESGASRRAMEDRWSRLKRLSVDNILASELTVPARLHRTRKIMVDVSIQTDNDILTDEAPQFAARPPQCRKAELLASCDFTDLDVHILTAPEEVTKDLTELVRYLCKSAKDDLQRLRVTFRWVTDNIRFDWKYMDKKQTAEEILTSRAGVSKDYVALLVEMCHLTGLRVKKIHGFARGRDFRVGRTFEADRDPLHSWMAVFLYGSWRFLDPTLSAGYMDAQGRYHPHLQEHYFLTDPDHFIHTHYPYDELEHHYDRWQLLDTPLTLEDFNSLPNVTPEFWSCGLKLGRPRYNPVVFRNQTEVTLVATTLIRYKYKFFPADQTEEACVNQWVFCTLKEGGAVGSFTIMAPEKTNYILKIYAGHEEHLEEEGSSLDHVVSFLLACEKARRYPVPWPLHDVAWGPTPRLYECGLDPVNQTGPVIVTWGGKKLIYFEKAFEIMIMFQVYNTEGHLLNLKGIIGSEETEEQLRLVIVPPGVGYYKLLIYGIPRPQVGGSAVRGRWRLPLLASYLIECKMSLENHPRDLQTADKKGKSKRKMRVVTRR
ncbi:uncharacterized protein [Panulirus ornatus]|uniref:uncharacterized protein isoform X2 n=1 Tax=Panulirus ornatus TaxID=150431 RepID=UPI003A872427